MSQPVRAWTAGNKEDIEERSDFDMSWTDIYRRPSHALDKTPVWGTTTRLFLSFKENTV